MAAVAGLNTYTLNLPARFSPTVKVDRLKPYLLRTGRPPSPGPITDPEQAGEYVVEQLLNRAPLPTTWCGGRASPQRTTRGSRTNTLQTARSWSLNTRLQHPAALRPSELTRVPVRRRSRRRPPRPPAAPPAAAPPPLTPARMGGGGRRPA